MNSDRRVVTATASDFSRRADRSRKKSRRASAWPIQAELVARVIAIAQHNDQLTNCVGDLEALQQLAIRRCIHGTSRTSPVREILTIVGDKWSSLILSVLRFGRCRYSIVRQLVSELSYERTISHHVLTAKLRVLERDGLITRTVWPSVPPRVEYQLTPIGESLVDKIQMLFQWAEDHFALIANAQSRFDDEPKPYTAEALHADAG